MTLEDKLEHFLKYTMEDTRKKCDSAVEAYRAALEEVFEEHKATKARLEELELKTESDRIIRENNKRFSQEQIRIRQNVSHRQAELKNKLFQEVEVELAAFRNTPAYNELLVKELKEAVAFARGEKVLLYVDSSDEERIPLLESEVGMLVKVSSSPFMGGMRAVIPGRNILIDNSFETKLTEAKESFRLKGGSSHEK